MSTTNPAATSERSEHSNTSIFRYQLPFELEREICEIVVSNFPRCIPNLILIARRFRVWFEPELYRTIRSGEGRVIPPLYHPPVMDSDFVGAVLNKPRIQAFGHHVQHVLLQRRSALEIAEVLECCPNVSNLALWIIGGTCTHLVPILEKLPLRRLSMDPSYFFPDYSPDVGIPFDQPMFRDITHLEIINSTSLWAKWRQLALLPRLTHLALAGSVNQEFIVRALEECRTIELFVMFYFSTGFLPGELVLPQEDDRVVILPSIADPLGHWERGSRGEEDFWMMAQKEKEEAIRSRKRRAERLAGSMMSNTRGLS